MHPFSKQRQNGIVEMILLMITNLHKDLSYKRIVSVLGRAYRHAQSKEGQAKIEKLQEISKNG